MLIVPAVFIISPLTVFSFSFVTHIVIITVIVVMVIYINMNVINLRHINIRSLIVSMVFTALLIFEIFLLLNELYHFFFVESFHHHST